MFSDLEKPYSPIPMSPSSVNSELFRMLDWPTIVLGRCLEQHIGRVRSLAWCATGIDFGSEVLDRKEEVKAAVLMASGLAQLIGMNNRIE